MTMALFLTKVKGMSKSSMQFLLVNAGISCYDEETEEDLRKSILYRIKTGELKEEDLIEEFV